jgi:serine/threonine protein kinase
MSNVKKGVWKFKAPVWGDISEDAKDFVSRLMTYNPDDRPTASDILKHKWIQNHITI